MNKSERPCFSEIYKMDAKNETKTYSLFRLIKPEHKQLISNQTGTAETMQMFAKTKMLCTCIPRQSYYQNN